MNSLFLLLSLLAAAPSRAEPGFADLRGRFSSARNPRLEELRQKAFECRTFPFIGEPRPDDEADTAVLFEDTMPLPRRAAQFGYKQLLALEPAEAWLFGAVNANTPLLEGGIGANVDFAASAKGIISVGFETSPPSCRKCREGATGGEDFELRLRGIGGADGTVSVIRRLGSGELVIENSILRWTWQSWNPGQPLPPASTLFPQDYLAFSYQRCGTAPLYPDALSRP